MPREIKEIKEFLLTARRRDARSVKIKKNPFNTKFKLIIQLRCSKFLYTLVIQDNDRAEKIRQSLPPGLQVKDLYGLMPREIKEIKEFLLTARRRDARSVKIKKNPFNTKFKLIIQLRCSKFLYTLVIQDNDRAEKIRQSLPPGLQVKDL
ncbi:hypothetical protein M514_16628 [Trichuris suis]|uniref:Large ribosomal subunit protein eL38 n=1 Tax=Trichuris suis TaxID=68888 RepID=A0A085NP85_9BILA|nr:hypothetical protein M514_16628 [Trichuris suis]